MGKQNLILQLRLNTLVHTSLLRPEIRLDCQAQVFNKDYASRYAICALSFTGGTHERSTVYWEEPFSRLLYNAARTASGPETVTPEEGSS